MKSFDVQDLLEYARCAPYHYGTIEVHRMVYASANLANQSMPRMEELEIIHRLGWKAFQDLCVAIVEEQTNRAVQTFLPTKDAGRDGAFRGRWDRPAARGDSTIQCKFASQRDDKLTLSKLEDELPKAKKLAIVFLDQAGLIDGGPDADPTMMAVLPGAGISLFLFST